MYMSPHLHRLMPVSRIKIKFLGGYDRDVGGDVRKGCSVSTSVIRIRL